MRLLFFPPFLMLLLFAPAALAYRYLEPAGRPPFLIFGIRWFLGLLFVVSGLAKLIPGFPNTMGPVNLEYTLAQYDLALFARFIAVSEVGIGLLLLTRRFATLGALGLVPMLASIIVITTSLHWVGTPYLVSGFLLLALVLLAYDYRRLSSLITDRPSPALGDRALPQPALLGWLTATGVVLVALGTIRFTSRNTPAVIAAVGSLTAIVILDWRRGTSA